MEDLRLKAEKEEEDRKKAEREEGMRAEVTPLEANAQSEADGGQHRYVRGYIFLFLGGFLLIREKQEWCM